MKSETRNLLGYDCVKNLLTIRALKLNHNVGEKQRFNFNKGCDMPRKASAPTAKKTSKRRAKPAAKRARRGPGRPASKKAAPRRGPRGGTPKQPFSLILDPDELSALKKMARQQGTSVASIIRQALHTVIFRTNPELAKTAIENEVNSFLDHMGNKLPLGQKGARRSRLKKQMVSGLLGGIKGK
jgi:hypothetical protein